MSRARPAYANLEDPGYRSLVAVPGIDETLADKLFAGEITSAAALAAADIEQIKDAAKVDDERAEDLRDMAAMSVASDR